MLISFDQVQLSANAPVFGWIVEPGERWAIMGPSASGKSQLLDVVQRLKRPSAGSARIFGIPVESDIEVGARATPESVAVRVQSKENIDQRVESLSTLGLWDVRKTPLSRLTAGQRSSCQLLPLLLTEGDILCADGTLDTLDPWVLPGTLDRLLHRCERGAVLVAVTARPDIAERLGHLAVMDARTMVLQGSINHLIDAHVTDQVIVSTENPSAVSGIANPFEVEAQEVEGGMLFRAKAGQELAARMLTEGYGNVRAVVHVRATLEDLLVKTMGSGQSCRI